MRLGLLTAALPRLHLYEVADWAQSNGFSMLEVACWPRSDIVDRRYSGVAHIDVVGLSATDADELVGELGSRGITISALGYYPNPLHPSPAVRAAVHSHLRAVMRAGALLKVPVVNTFIGADPQQTLDENCAEFRAVWPELVRCAADYGLRVAIENCPMIFSRDEWPSGCNPAYAPEIWRDIFEVIPGDTLGLNLDPSHLVWQMIDYVEAVQEFGSRIYHVHAKDLEIDRRGLFNRGVMSLGMGWQRPRIPGLGEVNWPRFVSALYRAGYNYVICVENEDRNFEGSEELVKCGFALARKTIEPLVV